MPTSTALVLLTTHPEEDEMSNNNSITRPPSASPVKMLLRLRNTRNHAATPIPPPAPAPIPPPPPSPAPRNFPAAHSPSTQRKFSPRKHRRPPSTAQTLWDQSRRPSKPTSDPTAVQPIPAGASRPLTILNIILAFQIIRHSAVQLMFQLLTDVHPFRLFLFLVLNAMRGLFPAFRTYSQVMLLDEVQIAVSAQTITHRLGWLLALEFFRMFCEAVFEHYTSANERLIQQTLKFHIEHAQLQTRLRLDIPSLSSQTTQDLLTESDLFARSFNGIGGLGLLSPFDLVRTFVVVGSEVMGRGWVVWGLWEDRRIAGFGFGGKEGMDVGQALIVLSVLGPTLLSFFNLVWNRLSSSDPSFGGSSMMTSPDSSTWPHALYNPEEAETCETHERMRRLAYDDGFKSEIMLFGLSDWILKTWVRTREKLLAASSDGGANSGSMRSRTRRNRNRTHGGGLLSTLLSPILAILPFDIDATTVVEFLRECTRDLMLTLQAIPLILQLSTTTLGTATLYRTTLTSLLTSVQTLSHTFDQTYQGIFLLAAFHASSMAQPLLEPVDPVPLSASFPSTSSTALTRTTTPSASMSSVATTQDGEGFDIECRNLWFTYPGADEPTIKGLNLKINSGETVAVVGTNGSGKSTLMHLLLRLFAYDGELDGQASGKDQPRILINGLDARLFSPKDLHSRSTAVFQGFCKFAGGSVKENVGVGSVEVLADDAGAADDSVVQGALKDGVGWSFVSAMKDGIETKLDAGGFSGSMGGGSFQLRAASQNRGMIDMGIPSKKKTKVALSGGQWQRLALSRLFIRGSSSKIANSSSASVSSSPPRTTSESSHRARRSPPSLILLDEASSQLDATAEHAIFSRLRRRFPKATIVFITHRLETVRWADKVAFFEGGKVTEFGSHDDLVQNEGAGGGYAKMWRDFEGGGSGAGSETGASAEDGFEEGGEE
ncbi:hypothetical protein FRB94_002573 [Tulasnella sp. JGI-2019a]|nr:hypothetical protein FRB93_004921 [Tulasnella sp. JGI-2019a]KAG9004217.1 hypothetical protein FRB94_002573 [Tulasnella sp. JGI-2019a]